HRPSTFGHLPWKKLLYSCVYPNPVSRMVVEGYNESERCLLSYDVRGVARRVEGLPHRLWAGPEERRRDPRGEDREGLHPSGRRRLDRAVRSRPPAQGCRGALGEAKSTGCPRRPRERGDLGPLPEGLPATSVSCPLW